MRPSRLKKFLKLLDNSLEKVVIFVLSIIVSTILPSTLIQFGFFASIRELIFIYARIFKSKTLAKPLVIQSAMLANADDMYTSSKFSLISPLVLEGVPDIEKIREIIKIQLLEKMHPTTGELYYPEILQNVTYWMGYPFWKKLKPERNNPEWFLQECVHFYKNDDQFDCDYNELERITNEELCFKPYDPEKPLIEFIIIPKFTPHPIKQSHIQPQDKKYSVLILRFHHVLADGYAILKLLKNLDISIAGTMDNLLIPNDYTQKTRLTNMSFPLRMVNYVFLVFKMIYQVTEYVYKSSLYSTSLWEWDKKPTSYKIWNKVNKMDLPKKQAQSFKSAWGKTFQLEKINDIKKIYNVSGTSVMYSAIVGSIRKIMFKKATLPYISFGMTLPLPRKDEKLRNRSLLSNIFIPLAEVDPIKRLYRIQQSINDLKKSTLPIAATFLSTGILGLLPRSLSRFVDNYTKRNEFCCISNIAGSKETVELFGHTVRDVYWTTGPAIDRNTIFICLISASGLAKISVTGHAGLLQSNEKAQTLVDNFFQELEILKNNNPI